jgi:hypothetical protein
MCDHTPKATTLPTGDRVCTACAETYFKALLVFAVKRVPVLIERKAA